MSTSPDTAKLRRDIGRRLAEERVGLKLNQDELGNIVGKSRRSIAAWEAGEQTPDADALALADMHGMDVLFVVTGRRGAVLSESQQLLVSYTRNVPEKALDAVLVTARTIGAYASGRDIEAAAPTADPSSDGGQGAKMVFNAKVTHAAGRDINNTGPAVKARKKRESF